MIDFCQGSAPKGFKPGYESFLFNTRKHRLLQSGKNWKDFFVLNQKNKLILATISFHCSEGIARSPYRAPFGAFELSERLRPKDFFRFVEWIEAELRKSGIKKIEIVCPPGLYQVHQELITTTLISLGYQIIQSDPGCIIMINEQPLQEKMAKSKQHRLKIGVRTGFEFKILPSASLKEIYKFLKRNMKEKGWTLSLTLSQLTKLVNAFPRSFIFSAAYSGKKIACAAVSIRINPSILYTFYSVHDKAFDKLSPRVFLTERHYEWCKENRYKLLDLGTSVLNGKPNFPLLDFKMWMGGTLTSKFTFQKSW